MAKEIERKFLVKNDPAWGDIQGIDIRQGYLCNSVARTVRVRISGTKGYLTVKGKTIGATRAEYEYGIPLEDAEMMLDNLCQRPLIEKIRRRVEHQGMLWEVDEFSGENSGLVVAEVELDDEKQTFTKPTWITEEVTEDPRYYNANLVSTPFQQWPDRAR